MDKKFNPYVISTLIYSVMALTLAWAAHFIPFGKETMLTVDLGQQYIDFFSLFKQTLFKTPEMFFYSFEKGIGGEMTGLWTYYLLSPFNFLFLFFNESNFHYAVSLVIYLKILAINLATLYFLRQKYHLETSMAILLALSYSLMSYVITNMLNIMWLDGLLLLPLIALALDRMLHTHRHGLYILSLSAALIINYYIAYMICIFLAFYCLFLILEKKTPFTWKQAGRDYGLFVRDSFIATLMAGIVLFPTIYSLSKSKGAYFESIFNLETRYSPSDFLAKIFIGAFNFDELKAGSPNLYTGLLVGILVLLFFLIKQIPWKQKVVAGLIFGVFYLSFHFNMLNRIWHGGQYPIWYHYRFAFIFSFFCIVLACKAWQALPNRIKGWQALGLLTFFLLAVYYYYGQLKQYDFLSTLTLALSIIFIFVYLLLLFSLSRKDKILKIGLLLLTMGELYTNATLIISEFSYIDKGKFEDYTQLLDRAVIGLQNGPNDFYRINKTFNRTKNEAMYAHYNGLNHFGSTMEASVIKLYGLLGLPGGSGHVIYTNGTLFLDDFFDVRYLLDRNPQSSSSGNSNTYDLYQEATNFDYQFYPLIDQNDRYVVRENVDRLGLGMEVSPALDQTVLLDNQPIANQNTLLNLLNFDQAEKQSFFIERPIRLGPLSGLTIANKGDGDYYTYKLQNRQEPGSFILNFQTPTANPYYFTLPSQFTSKKVKLQLDGQAYRTYTPFKARQITNAAYLSRQLNHQLKVILSKDGFKANLVSLYEFDLEKYQQLMKKQQSHLFKIDSFSHTNIIGNVNIIQKEARLLFSIPYDANWQINVDGRPVKARPVLNETLMAIPITQGQHKVALTYRPMAFYFGVISTIIGLFLLSLITLMKKKHRRPTHPVHVIEENTLEKDGSL